jgi:hypothetical protein
MDPEEFPVSTFGPAREAIAAGPSSLGDMRRLKAIALFWF